MKPTIKTGDYHLIVNDWESKANSEMTLYDHSGNALWKRPCLAKGTGGADYSRRSADTPPGVYKLGVLTVTGATESKSTWYSFGKYFIDLVGLNGEEERYGRAGCGVHGGGTGAPDPLAPYQQLVATHGCIRVYNADMEALILPRYKETLKCDSTFYVTVNQF